MTLLLREISPMVRSIRPSELEGLVRRAGQIRAELRQGVKKPYEDVLEVCWGDPHRGGVKPLTFVRQVLAACLYPQLAHSDRLPADVRHRARTLLEACDGGSVGSYTPTGGIDYVQERAAKFISRRDGGVPSMPENIFITSGAQRAIMQMILLVRSEDSPRTGVLVPIPTYPVVTMALEACGAAMVPYFLSEEQGWTLQIEELRKALQVAKGVCNPAVLYITNPGNPTGHVQSRKSIEEVIRFAAEEKLFLMADEVYQDNVFGEGSEFVSYKRVLAEMGAPHSSSVELASLHSASKGYMGECGLRGGYVELVNLDPAVAGYVYTHFSLDTCTAVTGQLALELMFDPPRPGDPSFPLYAQETEAIRTMLVQNVVRVREVLSGLPGLSCQPGQGGAFVFPRLHLPPGAVQKAKEAGVQPDLMYCSRLLEEAGLCVGPGFEHGQREGTHHVRLCVLTPEETMEEVLRRLSSFHLRFMEEFS